MSASGLGSVGSGGLTDQVMRSSRGAAGSMRFSSAASRVVRVTKPYVDSPFQLSGVGITPAPRLEADEPRARGGDADGAGAVGRGGAGDEAGGDRRGAAAAGAARRAVEVPRVARGAVPERLREGHRHQLGDVGLADDHRAVVAQPPHDLGVLARGTAVGDGALRGHLALDVRVVLDGDRDAEQRPVVPALAPRVGLVGLGQRALGEDDAEGVEDRVVPRDAVEAELRELARGDLAAADEVGLGSGSGEGDVVGHIVATYMRDVVEALTAFADRGACTDAERRAALWLHDDLRARGYEAWVETVWVRPQWAGSLLVHAALGVAASLACTAVPALALVAFALAVSYAAELLGFPVLARLFYRRATQTVVVEPPGQGIRVWLVARTDTDRSGAAFRERWRRLTRRLPVPWLVVGALLGVVAMGAVRATDAEGNWIGAVQLIPTVALLAAAAVALDHVLSSWTRGASAAAGAAVALALHEELTRRAPERLTVGLLLCPRPAFRTWRRAEQPVPADTVVIELGPCGGGEVAWATRHPQLVAAAGERGRRLPGRRTALPTLAVSTVSPGGVPPRIFSTHDTAGAVDEATLDAVYDFVLETVDRLDGALS